MGPHIFSNRQRRAGVLIGGSRENRLSQLFAKGVHRQALRLTKGETQLAWRRSFKSARIAGLRRCSLANGAIRELKAPARVCEVVAVDHSQAIITRPHQWS